MANNDKFTYEVDFLPASYREEGVKRRTKLWQLLVVAGFGGVLVATEMGHRQHQQRVQHDLSAVDDRYTSAEVRTQRLASLQAQVATAHARAELLTYLRHRWPTSQILAAIVDDVPESITLSTLEISRDTLPQAQPTGSNTLGVKDPTVDKLPAASRDLKQLRTESEASHTVVTIAGTMSDSAELHAYLETLGRSRLFSKVALNSIASPASDGERARFTARLIVRPGYGDPGAPGPKSSPSAEPPPSVARASASTPASK